MKVEQNRKRKSEKRLEAVQEKIRKMKNGKGKSKSERKREEERERF